MEIKDKEKLIELFDQLKYDHKLIDLAKDFITDYDGTKSDDINLFMMGILATLMQLQRFEIKAKAFDQMSEKNEEFSAALAKLTQTYNTLSKGDMPTSNSQSPQ